MMATAALAAVAVISCDNRKFCVEGQIANAQDSVLYFENVGLAGIEVLDSQKLGSNGTFSFSHPATDAPEFYRLRLSNQIINVSIDSTETVTVSATWPQMANDYDISGSDNCQKIKELSLKQMTLQQQVIQLERNTAMTTDQRRDSLVNLIYIYKEDVKQNYIFREPNKAYAYFALFQTIGPWLIFDPQNNRDDVRVFGAVATSWDTYYPNAERGENLHNIAIEGMKNVRIAQSNEQPATIEAEKVTESGVIDIELADSQGRLHRLTDLKGKVVILDFHLFGMEDSPKRILMLREVYNKYHAQGLEIYQVALDTDEHFWKQTTAALPWISVRAEDGIQSSELRLYNVQTIPEFFLIDRGNNLVKRSGQMTDLDNEIRRLL